MPHIKRDEPVSLSLDCGRHHMDVFHVRVVGISDRTLFVRIQANLKTFGPQRFEDRQPTRQFLEEVTAYLRQHTWRRPGLDQAEFSHLKESVRSPVRRCAPRNDHIRIQEQPEA